MFRIDLHQPPPDEIRRILLEQIAHARHGLLTQGASESAVHEARKACKRSRATLALVKGSLRTSDHRRLDTSLRDAARLIGPVRDADVMRHTLESLGEPAGGPPTDQELDRAVRGEQTIRGLDQARSLVTGQDLSAIDRSTLVEGLLRSWRGARKTWDDADVDHHPEAFHEWRKAVKRLLYHVQLLSGLDEAVMGGLARQLDVLQEALGDHHDLHVLAGQRWRSTATPGTALTERAAQLEERTLALGGWVLSAPPRQLQRWLQLTS